MTTQFSFRDSGTIPIPEEDRKLESWLSKFNDDAWRETATFIYEMPVTIIAMAIAGIASIIFFPIFTIPCFGTVIGTTLSRVGVKLIDKRDINILVELKSEVIELNKKYPNITTIAFIFATVVGLLFSTISWTVAIGLGIFKGIIIQIDIYNNNRNLRKHELAEMSK